MSKFALHNVMAFPRKVTKLLYEKLDHIPSSCRVLMVHVIQGRQYNACIVYKPHPGCHLNHKDGV